MQGIVSFNSPSSKNHSSLSERRTSFRLKHGGAVQRAAYGLLFAVLVAVCLMLTADTDIETRIVLLRYWALVAAGVYAIAVPHVLLPDAAVPMLQRLNRSPRRLLAHQLRAWRVVVMVFALPGMVLGLYDPGGFGEDLALKSLHLAANLLVVLGVGGYSFARYINIGPTSQAWQEGKKGGAYRRLKSGSTMGGFAVPDGLVPAITATTRVFAVGLLVLAASAYVGRGIAPALAWVPGLLLLGWSAETLRRLLPAYDRAFYATNAFYSELFRRAGGVHVADREPIPFRAVYWAPRRWKPSVWASLLQLDRKLPLGRFIALGHVGLWLLFFQDATPATVAVYLVLFIVAKNGASYLLVTKPFAPFPFRALRQPPPAWVATRFFVNLRWTLPFLLSLLAVAFLDPALGVAEALGWTGLDIAFALLTALLFTYGTEFQDRKRFA